MAEALTTPSLRGSFGDWIFYSCLMAGHGSRSTGDYAEEIHQDKALSGACLICPSNPKRGNSGYRTHTIVFMAPLS